VCFYLARNDFARAEDCGPLNCFLIPSIHKRRSFSKQIALLFETNKEQVAMADESPRPPDTDSKGKTERVTQDGADARKEMSLLGLGMQLALTVALFAGTGWWLDAKMGWSPWGVAGLGMAGLALGLYQFVKDATR
jgi:F0F1-type ATP synthase assembly protein I